jgi:coproporphyrinogen III oxidase-like Fe-S oxidoreductase
MNQFGVYVHIPFCAHRCDYCAFATYADRDHLMARYVEAVLAEIEAAKTSVAARRRDFHPSSYFGYSTPFPVVTMPKSPWSATPKMRPTSVSVPIAPGESPA